MRARTKRSSAIGATACLALVAAGVAAPSAGAAPVGCSYLQGATITANSVSISATLTAGDTITAKVSPATTGDKVILSTAVGTSIYFRDAEASTGVVFKAPATQTYNLGYSFEAAGVRPGTLTYSFTATCSSTTVTPTPIPTTKPPKGKKP